MQSSSLRPQRTCCTGSGAHHGRLVPLRASRLSRTARLGVLAFKETDEIKDWRIKDMVSKTHTYFDALWSKGQLGLADQLLDPDFVHRDLCSGWAAAPSSGQAAKATGVVVGPRAFKAMVAEARRQYPDLWVEVEQVAVSNTNQLFVLWTSHGTQLEADGAHTPSYHNAPVSGVDLIRFNADRSRIVEVNVFRQLTKEERRDVERRASPNPLEIHLARLHWEPAEKAADAAAAAGQAPQSRPSPAARKATHGHKAGGSSPSRS